MTVGTEAMAKLEPPTATARPRSRQQLAELVVHLTQRQLESAHRFTFLGWLWPLARQLAQLAVLVFVFSKVLDLGIENYAIFVFAGLVVWGWFASAVTRATGVLVANRHLVFSPGFPSVVLPLVAVAVPLIDIASALPVLVVMLAVEGQLHATALLLLPLLVLEFVLIAGIALATASANVYFRDVEHLTGLVLLLLFYLTPVFYGLRNVPERFHWMLELNPLTPLIGSVRRVLIEGSLPMVSDLLALVTTSAVVAALGAWIFWRLEPDLVDEL
jgi:lipopolysaccharide transport system permease protein